MTTAELFLRERDIPYRIPLACSEPDHCCSGKHERLKRAFEDRGIDVRYRICWFRWSDLPLPPEVASVPHADDCTHVYLEMNVDGAWRIVDATWDPGLRSVFPVNEWVEDADMAVAVPAVRTLSPEESAAYMAALTQHDAEADLEKHGPFYRALNDWFIQVRSNEKPLG